MCIRDSILPDGVGYGDAVILKDASGEYLIKRIAGLPGDVMEVDLSLIHICNIRIIVPDQTTLDNLKFTPDGSLQNPSFTAKWLSHDNTCLLYTSSYKSF